MADKLCFIGNMYFSQIQYSGLQGQCQFFCRPWYVITALITTCFNFLLDIEAWMIYTMLIHEIKTKDESELVLNVLFHTMHL